MTTVLTFCVLSMDGVALISSLYSRKALVRQYLAMLGLWLVSLVLIVNIVSVLFLYLLFTFVVNKHYVSASNSLLCFLVSHVVTWPRLTRKVYSSIGTVSLPLTRSVTRFFKTVSNSIKDSQSHFFLLGSLVLVFPSFASGPYVNSSRRYVTSLPTSRVIRLVRMGHRVSTCPWSHLGDPFPMLVYRNTYSVHQNRCIAHVLKVLKYTFNINPNGVIVHLKGCKWLVAGAAPQKV